MTTFPNLYLANDRNTYVKFTGRPLVQEAVAAGSIGVVTTNHTNAWDLGGHYFEQYNTVDIAQVVPDFGSVLNGGLNIGSLCDAAADEIEITQGNSAAIRNCFVTRTSPSFYVRATFNIKTLADVTELSVGFRKVQTYTASPLSTYTDYAIIGVSGTAGAIKTQTGIAGVYVVTDTTNTATAATNFTVQVNIDGSGNVTYMWSSGNAVLAAPSTVVAAQMGASLNFVPWIHYKVSAAAADEVDLLSFSCGLF